MFVEDFIRQCVLFLGNKDSETGKFIPRATAFGASVHEGGIGFRYVVTAEHAIAGFSKKGWDIHIRSNRINGGVREDSWAGARWFFHPVPGSTDVAVATIDFQPGEEFKTVLLRSDLPNHEGMAATASLMQEWVWVTRFYRRSF